MTKIVALFNHKGGVSKTTTTFNLGWMLAEQGHQVVIVDADPQCNLTGMVLGYKGPADLEQLYEQHPDRNLYAGLAPAFESRPEVILGVECIQVEGRDGLFLLPGHVGVSEYEVTLGIAQELSGSIQTLQNLPGSVRYLLDQTAGLVSADFVMVDMSPGLGAINQNLLATSDFFMVPTSPDFFSVMAIDSLARVLPRWKEWADRAAKLDLLRTAVYPFPEPHPKFLGTVVQKYRPRGGAPAQAFQKWIDTIADKVEHHLLPVLRGAGMSLPKMSYAAVGMGSDTTLAVIPDFNSLIAKSQEFQTPVFALTAEQLGQAGVVLEASEGSRDQFHETFTSLAERVVALTGDASGD
jgi:cellulose biosynthesis protein BcsQ